MRFAPFTKFKYMRKNGCTVVAECKLDPMPNVASFQKQSRSCGPISLIENDQQTSSRLPWYRKSKSEVRCDRKGCDKVCCILSCAATPYIWLRGPQSVTVHWEDHFRSNWNRLKITGHQNIRFQKSMFQLYLKYFCSLDPNTRSYGPIS